ncbi:MAG TPA: cyclopropane-fatty-acyl-phospholipid synthase family protein [Kofleriaceae bacterium]|jgi:cyclopropane-fatty-acyl-phospholipid synthase
MLVERIVDAGVVPEPILRAAIRAVCRMRLRDEAKRDPNAFVASLRASDVAIETAAANAQHYEVPPAFFERVLGAHLKYSACYWPAGVHELDAAEAAMLELYAERAQLADGQDVLDLGCGWGSFALWAARRYPNSRVTAISNSHAQRAFIESRAPANLVVRTADVRALELPAASFDRVVSIEMLEHVRNYGVLFHRIASWLRPGGAMFAHVFAHARYAYPFEDAGASDWMAREFFTGGIMPSARLFHCFDDDLTIADEWQLDGTHYARTAEAWHRNLVASRDAIEAILGERRRYHRWRVFFLACAELFGYRAGREWIVAHYRLVPR